MPDHLNEHDLARLGEITRFTTDALPERTSLLHQEDAALLARLLAEHAAAVPATEEGEERCCPQCGGTPDAPASDPVNGPKVPCCDPIHKLPEPARSARLLYAGLELAGPDHDPEADRV